MYIYHVTINRTSGSKKSLKGNVFYPWERNNGKLSVVTIQCIRSTLSYWKTLTTICFVQLLGCGCKVSQQVGPTRQLGFLTMLYIVLFISFSRRGKTTMAKFKRLAESFDSWETNNTCNRWSGCANHFQCTGVFAWCTLKSFYQVRFAHLFSFVACEYSATV